MPSLPLGRLRPLPTVRRPPIANVFTGKPSNDEKSIRKVSSCLMKENLVEKRPRAPSNDEKSLRKVPQITTARRPPWVKWRPPRPCPPPPLRDFLNTLLSVFDTWCHFANKITGFAALVVLWYFCINLQH